MSVTVLSYCLFLPDHWLDLENKHLRNRHIARLQAGGHELDSVLEQFRADYASSYTYQFWGSTFGSYIDADEQFSTIREFGEGDPRQRWRLDSRCGPKRSKVGLAEGVSVVECDPESHLFCCSPLGWCGKTAAHCECDGCVDYKAKAAKELAAQR